MMRHNVRTPEDALLYIADCQLATCEYLAMKKSRSEHEYLRQKSIAQTICNFISDFKIKADKGNRVEQVVNCGNSVEDILKKYDVRIKQKNLG